MPVFGVVGKGIDEYMYLTDARLRSNVLFNFLANGRARKVNDCWVVDVDLMLPRFYAAGYLFVLGGLLLLLINGLFFTIVGWFGLVFGCAMSLGRCLWSGRLWFWALRGGLRKAGIDSSVSFVGVDECVRRLL